jgi:hypothetical protein
VISWDKPLEGLPLGRTRLVLLVCGAEFDEARSSSSFFTAAPSSGDNSALMSMVGGDVR